MGVLDAKVVVITGSTRGLGLAMAEACAAAGAAVVVSSRSSGAVDQAVARLCAGGARASGQVCDVGDLAQVESLGRHAVETFGRFDVWINNAGASAPFGPTMHLPPGEFLTIVHTNILGTYHGSLVALRHFYPRHSGKLINLLGRGDTGPVPLQNAYTASKIWVRSFTKALAQEYRDDGVGVFAYNPGLTITSMLTDVDAIAGYEKRLEPLKTVMRMWGHSPEVPAQRIVWLASGATDGKTGLEVRELGPLQLAGGALREGIRRVLGKTAPMPLRVTTVQPPAPFGTGQVAQDEAASAGVAGQATSEAGAA